MTFTGKPQTLTGRNAQKEHSYGPRNALVGIVFNALGQTVSTNVVEQIAGSGGDTSPASGAPTPPSNTAPLTTSQAQAQAPRRQTSQAQQPQAQVPQACG